MYLEPDKPSLKMPVCRRQLRSPGTKPVGPSKPQFLHLQQ